MNLIIETSELFEKSFRSFSKKEKEQILKAIEYYGELFVTNRKEFLKNAHQPVFFKINDEFDSSLYYLKLKKEIRLIVSVDEDPDFRIRNNYFAKNFQNQGYRKKFKSVAESFYQKFSNVKQI
jgi:hypothetical protein